MKNSSEVEYLGISPLKFSTSDIHAYCVHGLMFRVHVDAFLVYDDYWAEHAGADTIKALDRILAWEEDQTNPKASLLRAAKVENVLKAIRANSSTMDTGDVEGKDFKVNSVFFHGGRLEFEVGKHDVEAITHVSGTEYKVTLTNGNFHIIHDGTLASYKKTEK